MMFILWSKKVIPFPLLDIKYKHFRMTRDKRWHWNDGSAFQFSALPKCLDIQERAPLAKSEADGWVRIGLTL